MGTLDGYEQSEQIAKEIFGTENVITVRSGELRGNGPLLLADLSARLVDNMYDVKFQDLYAFQGDSQQGYTKRLNLAQTLVRIAENPSCVGSVRDVSILSVVCKTLPIVGEQTVSEPTDRERRKGYDMSKGVAPPVIDAAIRFVARKSSTNCCCWKVRNRSAHVFFVTPVARPVLLLHLFLFTLHVLFFFFFFLTFSHHPSLYLANDDDDGKNVFLLLVSRAFRRSARRGKTRGKMRVERTVSRPEREER